MLNENIVSSFYAHMTVTFKLIIQSMERIWDDPSKGTINLKETFMELRKNLHMSVIYEVQVDEFE